MTAGEIALLPNMNEFADFWRNTIGGNVIPADTKNKVPLVKWTQFQDSPISEEQHDKWKDDHAFDKGMAIIAGKIWHNALKTGLYLIFVDLDNEKAIEEFCTTRGKSVTLEEMSKHMIIEQHKDELNKAHAYFYSKHPFAKKSSDRVSNIGNRIDSNEIPAIEVKGLGSHGIAYCTPSPHKNGRNYEILGTIEPETIDELEEDIDSICKKYGIPYLDNDNGKSLPPIQDLLKEDTRIHQGHNRHEAVLRIMESWISRLGNILEQDQIRKLSHDWNQKHCIPPLDETEENRQWNDAMRFIQSKNSENSEQNSHDDNYDGRSVSNGSQTQSQTNADILVQLAIKNIKQFFKNQYDTPYGVVRFADHDEVIALENTKFKRFLSKLFYDNNDHKVINTDILSNVNNILQAKAYYGSPIIHQSLRVAWSNEKDAIYYDLTDEKWRSIMITRDQWKILDKSPILFVRYNQVPQVEPNNSYEHDIFDKFLSLTNVKDRESQLLLKVYIVSLFIPDIDHVMLILHGEKGSAKSTLQTMIKLLVDPAKPSLLTVHSSRDEFVQQVNHNYVAYYDNIKHVPQWLSDEACKAATGVGNTKRKLYSDDEDIVYEYKRCLGFNGINISLTEPDALDRSVLIELHRIRRESNQVKSKILTDFEELRPRLLGYIFDILSKALSLKDTVKLVELPRMADFAIWGEAVARAMGYKPLEFMNAYYGNIGRQNIEVIDAHPLGLAIVKLCSQLEDSRQVEWFGSITEFSDKLKEIAELNKINTDSKLWPKATNSLSRSLNSIRSNLLEGLGIEVTISRVTVEDHKYKKEHLYRQNTKSISTISTTSTGSKSNTIFNSKKWGSY